MGADKKVILGLCGRATTVTRRCGLIFAADHEGCKRQGLVVEFRYLYAFVEGLGGESLVDCRPIEKVESGLGVTMEFVGLGLGGNDVAAGNMLEDGGAKEWCSDAGEGVEALIMGWGEGSRGVGCAMEDGVGGMGADKVVNLYVEEFVV